MPWYWIDDRPRRRGFSYGGDPSFRGGCVSGCWSLFVLMFMGALLVLFLAGVVALFAG